MTVFKTDRKFRCCYCNRTIAYVEVPKLLCLTRLKQNGWNPDNANHVPSALEELMR